jgi:hypothetical protein
MEMIEQRTDEGSSRARLRALVAFGETLDPELYLNPKGAAAALRTAGYTVVPMPEEYRPLLDYQRDDFLEAWIDVPAGENVTLFGGAKYEKKLSLAYDDKLMGQMWEAVDTIVDQFGGSCEELEWLPAGMDYVPFSSIGLSQRYKEIKK